MVNLTGERLTLFNLLKGAKAGKFKKRKKKSGIKGLSKRVKTLEQNQEMKFFDVNTTATAVTSTAAIIELTNIPAGDSATERDGNKIVIKKIQAKGLLAQDETLSQVTVRIMIVMDTQTNEAPYISGDLLNDITLSDAIVSFRELDERSRFRVFFDRVFQLNDAFGFRADWSFFKDVNIVIDFDASTPSIADLPRNSLSLFLISDTVLNGPTHTTHVRLRFIDN